MALLAIETLPLSFTSSSSSSLNPSNSSCLSFSRTGSLSAGASLSLYTTSLWVAAPQTPLHSLVYCGRGDKKTAKGKRFKHSFGNARPRSEKKGRGPPRGPMPPALPKKDKFDDGEIVNFEINESLFS